MNSVGMLRTNKRPLILARSVAYVCQHYQINFFYFSPEDVDTKNKKINAQFFEKGKWIRKKVDYPCIVDNEPMKSVNKELYASLKEDSILTTNPIGGKSKVFRMLENSGLFEDVLIPYVLVEKTDDVLLFLKRYNKILLKPVFSNQGRNIIVIEQLGDVYRLMDDNVTTEYSYAELIDILNLKYLNPTYICQPFIESKTKEGSPFDIRLHVRKNENGEWQKVKIYPRIGMGKNITSNISQGGGISPIVPFLQSNFGGEWKKIKDKLELLCRTFPNRFESLYNYNLDALGIDLGVDSKGNIGLFEVNTYPGQQFFYAEDAEVRVAYYRYLLQLK
ncbi:YheC/YheD family protein [Staphylococcus haemolyticus]|uniref:YheC/YheD family protein n=1 Tax=Staphylococcus haemolyticus TaxID=1283 RepID=UPI00265BCFB5|nr:YheC/YheD family protein [Staphylococcus haemolyticus]MDO0962934.1 YheC/YheD family protein [Staphylococcus haemolyticus]